MWFFTVGKNEKIHFFVCWIITTRSTTELHLHTPPPSNLSFLLSLPFHLSLSCINASSPSWKPFALIYEGLFTVHIINLSPLWHSSAGIHPPFFILSVLLQSTLDRGQGNALWDYQGVLTGMKCELPPSGFATAADLCKPVPASLCFLCQSSQTISHLILKWQMKKYSKTA